jgi:hypothetical protein
MDQCGRDKSVERVVFELRPMLVDPLPPRDRYTPENSGSEFQPVGFQRIKVFFLIHDQSCKLSCPLQCNATGFYKALLF